MKLLQLRQREEALQLPHELDVHHASRGVGARTAGVEVRVGRIELRGIGVRLARDLHQTNDARHFVDKLPR